jgi:hypothetical protein
VICKDDAAIKCITVQHKERLIPVNFDGAGHTLLVVVNSSDKTNRSKRARLTHRPYDGGSKDL